MSEQMEASERTEGISNVVDLATARRKHEQDAEPFLTDQERREIREMLAYFKAERPIYEAAKGRCTILRRLTEEGI